jgi:hypothetical protein
VGDDRGVESAGGVHSDLDVAAQPHVDGACHFLADAFQGFFLGGGGRPGCEVEAGPAAALDTVAV